MGRNGEKAFEMAIDGPGASILNGLADGDRLINERLITEIVEIDVQGTFPNGVEAEGRAEARQRCLRAADECIRLVE